MAWQGQAGPEDAGGGGSVGGISAEVRMDSAPLAADMARVNAMLTSLESKLGITAAAATNLGAGLKQATSGMTSFGSRMLIVGQFVDDMQYGLRAVVNQIPQAAMAFGAGAGLAGVLSVAAVAANQLVNRWDDVTAAFGRSKTLTQAEEMDKLAKATSRTADEQERLNRFTRENATTKQQSERRPAVEGEIGKAVAGEVGELGADELRTRIRRNMLAALPPPTEAAIQKELSNHIRRTPVGGIGEAELRAAREASIRAINDRRAKEMTDAAERLLSNAESGPGMIGEEARGRLSRMFPGIEGRVFRDPRGEATESERLIAEGTAGAKAYDEKVARERMDAMGVEARHAAEEEAMANARRAEGQREEERVLQAEQDRNVAAFDEAQRVKAATGPMTIAGALAAGRRNQDHFARMQRLGDRLRDVMTPEVSQSQVFGMSDLNARVQSSVTNGPDRLLRVQQETKKVLDDIRETVRAFNRPVKVGGR
jgi:hypothetical protein